MDELAQVGPTTMCEGSSRQPSLSERLTRKKQSLEENLAEVNEALALLEKNPEFQKLFDAVSRVR